MSAAVMRSVLLADRGSNLSGAEFALLQLAGHCRERVAASCRKRLR
jgi:hypothetical protein